MSMRKRICFATGWLCVVLGVAGIFLPLLPTTPFLLAAAFCFGESSPRFHRWLTGNRYLNSYLENYRSGLRRLPQDQGAQPDVSMGDAGGFGAAGA